MDEKMLLQAIQQIVKTEIEPLNGRMDEMSGRIDRMENRMDRMEGRMDRVEILLEHEIPKQLQLLAEGPSGNCGAFAQGTRNGGSSLPSEYAGAGIGGSQ